MQWNLFVHLMFINVLFNLYCIFSITLQCPYTPSNHHTGVRVYECFCLFAQSFHHLTPPRSLAVILLSVYESVPIFHVSSVSSLIPHVSEIIWYLFFSVWLILLSIMFSVSIHTVTMGEIFLFFLWPSNIPLHKWPIVALSTHLLMDTWAASISWWLWRTLQWT